MDGSFAEGYAVGRDGSNNNNGNGAWGGDWAWWIVILLIFGWGNGGFGGFGGNGGANSPGLQGLATRADINEGFAMNGLQNGIEGIKNNQLTLETSLCNRFSGLQAEIANCCCQTQRAIDGVNYNAAKNTCDIISAINSNTRDLIEVTNAQTQRLVDIDTQREMSALRTELAQAQGQLSQAQQTNNIVNALRTPAPIPAYVVQNPACCNPIPYGCGCGNGY